jgi:hypothetical protein
MEMFTQVLKDLLVNGLSLILLLGLAYYIFPKILRKVGYQNITPTDSLNFSKVEEELNMVEKYANLSWKAHGNLKDHNERFEKALKDLVFIYERVFGKVDEKDERFLGIVLLKRGNENEFDN